MVNVFSFCLYGPLNPRYYPDPMNENINLVLKYFPDWKVFVYLGSDVDPRYIEHLATAPNVILRYTGVVGAANMIHRFYAIDEPGVETMLVRDADSRIHWKDRWAIRSFMKSGYWAHTIRDNSQHSTFMMGGLWGLRKEAGLNIHAEYEAFKNNPSSIGMGHDQDFLALQIYPKIMSHMLVHYSFDLRGIGEHAVEFPFKWTNDIYCGKIEQVGYVEPTQPTAPEQFLPRSFKKSA